jgi:hypothetical protein
MVFSTEVTLGFAGGDTNLYRRVGNSPINATDPSGNAANVAFGAAAGAVIGGGFYLVSNAISGRGFSFSEFMIATTSGAVSGAVAGATFGISLAAGSAVAGGLGLTGTAGSAVTASVTLGMTGTLAGGAGGFVTGAGGTAASGGSLGEIAIGGGVGAGRGAFYGWASGLAAGAVLPFTAMAGIGLGGGVLGGRLALGGSAMLGDVVAQGLGNVVGLQRGYDPTQTLFAGAIAGTVGGRVGRQDPGLLAFKSGFQSLRTFTGTKRPWDSGATPYSKYIQRMADGRVRTVARYDDQGNILSHIDYIQDSPHRVVIDGRRVNLRDHIHEHRANMFRRPDGTVYWKWQIRLVDADGNPQSGWVNESGRAK